MSTFDRIARLPLIVEDWSLEGRSLDVSTGFTRKTTIIRLRGDGCEGVGEDVTYSADAHDLWQASPPELDLTGRFTLAGFSERVGEQSLFPEPPEQESGYDYRRWGFESAALDLALRQAGRSLSEQLDRSARPIRWVLSLNLGKGTPSLQPIEARLNQYPELHFKLDATPSWTEAFIREVADRVPVEVVDFKAFYTGTPVDTEPSAELYDRVATVLPDVVLEDPAWNDETAVVLKRHADRIAWDAPIHSVADLERMPIETRVMNIKPSRFGSLESLFAMYDHCEREGITMYGGGQFELGPGRDQIQALAAIFHPDAPNDVAPRGYHTDQLPDGLPTSPLQPQLLDAGFGRK